MTVEFYKHYYKREGIFYIYARIGKKWSFVTYLGTGFVFNNCPKKFDLHGMFVFFQVKRGHFSIPVFIPTDVQDMIRGMINVDPAKRLTVE